MPIARCSIAARRDVFTRLTVAAGARSDGHALGEIDRVELFKALERQRAIDQDEAKQQKAAEPKRTIQ